MGDLTIAAQLDRLTAYLAGEFDNRQQSLADPAWFLHLRLWYRPLPRSVFSEGYGFFIEQVSVASGQSPYRQRVLQVMVRGDRLWGQFYGLADPVAYAGAATQPHRLASLSPAELIDLPTCAVAFDYNAAADTFRGRLPADSLCCFEANGVTTYVRLELDIGPDSPTISPTTGSPVVLKMGDRGIDPETGKATWGPQMGPFCLVKQQAYPLPQ